MLAINRVNRSVLDSDNEPKAQPIKQQLFNELKKLSPNSKVLQIGITPEKSRDRYIRTIVSQYNKNEAEDGIEFHTKVNKEKNKAYVYATSVN